MFILTEDGKASTRYTQGYTYGVRDGALSIDLPVQLKLDISVILSYLPDNVGLYDKFDEIYEGAQDEFVRGYHHGYRDAMQAQMDRIVVAVNDAVRLDEVPD